jgi:hypothetical protein
VILSDAAYTAGGLAELIKRVQRERAEDEQRRHELKLQRARERRRLRKGSP